MFKEPTQEDLLEEIIELSKKFIDLNSYLSSKSSNYYSFERNQITDKILYLLALFFQSNATTVKLYLNPNSFQNESYIDFRHNDMYLGNYWEVKKKLKSNFDSQNKMLVELFLNHSDIIVNSINKELKNIQERKKKIEKEKQEAIKILKPFLVLETL